MKSKKSLILEFDDRCVKACGFKMAAKKPLVEYLDAFEFSHDVSAQDIEEVFLKLPKVKYDKVFVSLSRTFFLIRFLTLPSQKREEIEKLLFYQLAKIIPSPLEETRYNFSFLPTKEGFSEVVVFLIPDKKIRPITEVLQKHKLMPEAITMSSFGLYQLGVIEGRPLAGSGSPLSLLIDIDKHCADFLVINKKMLVFSRAFYYEDDPGLLEGINHSLMIFERKFASRNFGEVIFTGKEDRAVIGKINLGSPAFISYWEKFAFSQGVPENAKAGGFSFASILGLASAGDLSKFDFSPQSVREGREDKTKAKKYRDIIAVIAEIVLIFSILMFGQIYQSQSRLKYLDEKLSAVKLEAKELNKVSDRLKILDKELAKKALFSELLYGLISVVPPDVRLSALDFQENKSFSIKGYADDEASVFALSASLNKTGIFKAARVKYASSIKQNDKLTAEFLIEGMF